MRNHGKNATALLVLLWVPLIEDDAIDSELAPPFDILIGAVRSTAGSHPHWSAWEASFNADDPGGSEVAGLKEHRLVGAPGIEPGTSRV